MSLKVQTQLGRIPVRKNASGSSLGNHFVACVERLYRRLQIRLGARAVIARQLGCALHHLGDAEQQIHICEGPAVICRGGARQLLKNVDAFSRSRSASSVLPNFTRICPLSESASACAPQSCRRVCPAWGLAFRAMLDRTACWLIEPRDYVR